MLGLRLADGRSISSAQQASSAPPLWTPERARARDRLIRARQAHACAAAAVLVPKANWLFADGIIAELMTRLALRLDARACGVARRSKRQRRTSAPKANPSEPWGVPAATRAAARAR